MSDKKFPTYEQVKNALIVVNAVTSTSEAHGLLSGLICVGVVSDTSGDSWVKSMLPGETEKILTEDDMQILSDLFEVTRQKIDELEFDFELLLPNDDESLKDRAQELGAWCKGFIIGLNLGGFNDITPRSDDCDEALQRMTEIASIDYTALEISEDDEVAYTEVTEYVRLAVLMLHAELCRQSDFDGTGHESNTIH